MWRRFLAGLRRLGGPPVRRVAAVVVAVVAGGWLGLILGGNHTTEVGPVQASFSVRPWPTGDTTVSVSPLGTVTFDTHDGPLRIEAAVERVRPEAAKGIVRNPDSLEGLGERVARDLRDGLIRLLVKSALSAVLGATVFALVVYRRRWRWIAASGLGASLFMIGTVLAGYLTFDPRSIEEPRYTGLLTSAPRVVGNVAHLAENFSHYREELARTVTNVSQLYSVTSGLNPFDPNPSTVRVLHVSDLHLNPAGWSIMHSVAEQFEVGLIVDSGDIVDNGSAVENRYVAEISTFDVPYVYVRGNHDSQVTLEAVAREPNAVVLDGTIKEVKGLRFFGAGDPRFASDRTTRATPDDEMLRAVGLQLAEQLRTAQPPADVAVIHDPAESKALAGSVPLVLSGHMHSRSTRLLPGRTRLMVQGSTGGAGLRALDGGEEPTPMTLSVLYFDKKTGRLQAWDAIEVGGLGLSSAQITRHVAPNPDREIRPPAERSPTPSVDPSAAGEAARRHRPTATPGVEPSTATGRPRGVRGSAAESAPN